MICILSVQKKFLAICISPQTKPDIVLSAKYIINKRQSLLTAEWSQRFHEDMSILVFQCRNHPELTSCLSPLSQPLIEFSLLEKKTNMYKYVQS